MTVAELKTLAREIVDRLTASGSPKRSKSNETYCPTAAVVLGVPAVDVEATTRETTRNLETEPARTVYRLVSELVGTGIFEARAVGWLVLAAHKDAMAAITEKEIIKFARGLDNWAATDVYGTWVAGPAWREGRIGTRLINRWTKTPDPWFRRLALVSTVALNVKARGGFGDPPRTFAVCRRLVDDKNPMVAKALSWALRAVVQHDPRGVEQFLDQHSERLPAIVRREVRNKLDTGLKTPRKKRA